MPPTHSIPAARILDRVLDRTMGFYLAHRIVALRIALGLVYVWFGVLKFFNGASPAAKLATDTMSALTFGAVPAGVSRPLLATMETLIGLGFLSGRLPRLTAVVFLVQMAGAMSSVVLAHSEVWKSAPLVPTLAGQYVIKDLILLTGGLVVLTAPGRIRRPMVSQDAFDYLTAAARPYPTRRRLGDLPTADRDVRGHRDQA